MSQIYTINKGRAFNLEEAQELLPVVVKITRSYSEQVKILVDRIEGQPDSLKDTNWKVEQEINTLIEAWKSKMTRLGITPRGLWIGDFPTDNGFYCWKFPEEKINFWHSKEDGFSKRRSIYSVNDQTT